MLLTTLAGLGAIVGGVVQGTVPIVAVGVIIALVLARDVALAPIGSSRQAD